ncbi:MAG TPA: HEAT repeat domain-containing protein, partial [Aggregatilineales bacterium]|nr:HEAT repeat domain-containing protein [Aggregatilineales bacterium]
AEALGKIGDNRALPALFLASEDIHPLVRLAVAQALGKLKDASAIPTLMRLLKDESVEVRQASALALGELGNAIDIPQESFLDLLADPSDELRALGRKIFVALGGSGANSL